MTVRHQPDAAASLGRVEHGGVGEPAQPLQQPFHDRQVHAADQSGVLGGQGAERAVGQGQPGRVAPGLIPLVIQDTALVCGMNAALVDGVLGALRPAGATSRLDPAPGRCCVVVDLPPARSA